MGEWSFTTATTKHSWLIDHNNSETKTLFLVRDSQNNTFSTNKSASLHFSQHQNSNIYEKLIPALKKERN